MNQPSTNPEVKPENISRIKTIIMTIVLLTVLILGSILTSNYYNKKKIEDRTNKDQIIIKTMFDLRSLATAYYEKNQSYKNWQPADQTSNEIKNLGADLIFRKSDYQNYIMYTYISSHGKYFCIDTTGFADEVDIISDQQNQCN